MGPVDESHTTIGIELEERGHTVQIVERTGVPPWQNRHGFSDHFLAPGKPVAYCNLSTINVEDLDRLKG